jgi:Transposase domain (DUF772)
MGASSKWRDVLVDDEDYAPLNKDSTKGRPPSIPSPIVVLAVLLEYHDDCSDVEAEQRMSFDLRWQHVLGLGLEYEGFDATVSWTAAHILGAARARDTYALIRGGISKLLGLWDTRRRERSSSLNGSFGTWTQRHLRSPTSTGATLKLVPSTSRRSSPTPERRCRWRRVLLRVPLRPRCRRSGDASITGS